MGQRAVTVASIFWEKNNLHSVWNVFSSTPQRELTRQRRPVPGIEVHSGSGSSVRWMEKVIECKLSF